MTDVFVDLSEIQSDLMNATSRDLRRGRSARRKKGVALAVLTLAVMSSGVAVAAQQGIIPNVFNPKLRGSEQIAALPSAGRVIDPRNPMEASAAQLLSSDRPGMSEPRVLLDKGDKFKMIGATTKNGAICWVTAGLGEAGAGPNCLPRLEVERPMTSTTLEFKDGTRGVTGLVANGVTDIRIESASGSHSVDFENDAYIWIGKKGELPTGMSARRPDGTLFHYAMAPPSPQTPSPACMDLAGPPPTCNH